MKENGQKRAGGQGGKRPRQAARPQAGPRRQQERRQEGNTAANGLPQCPVARQCGACQHVNQPYDRQLAVKDERVAQLFSQVAAPEALRPILGMQDPYAYRNKVMSPFAPGAPRKAAPAKRGGGKRPSRPASPQRDILCGMYAAGTHRIIDTGECLIENAQAKQVIRAVRSLMLKFGIPPYDEDRGTGFMRHAVVRVGHTTGEVLVTLVTNGQQFPGAKSFCRELVRRCPFITTVVQNINERQTNVVLGQREQVLYGPGFILDKLCGLSFRISSQSFYQVNSVQTEVLYRQAIELAGFTGAEHAIDAYCGTGTIGLVAASMGAARWPMPVRSCATWRRRPRRQGVRAPTRRGARSCCSWIRRAPAPPRSFCAPRCSWRPSASSTSRAIRKRRSATWAFSSSSATACERCSPWTCSRTPTISRPSRSSSACSGNHIYR